ncbi:hypothetical protein F0M18_12915 [Pseudohalioglobus sediminis]|uniref:Uncharacterized protein n=1 Tax=Pseudohalioglobus sediminis TaxID=2606449 RepID=A0A5B0WSC0_9GAMM|nr:hypothetical protein [Pseudohalioglobus sediminis]KAA1189970.1 hypothetical protein F0M18_12915 [Pseudohalioglobus sediminis]
MSVFTKFIKAYPLVVLCVWLGGVNSVANASLLHPQNGSHQADELQLAALLQDSVAMPASVVTVGSEAPVFSQSYEILPLTGAGVGAAGAAELRDNTMRAESGDGLVWLLLSAVLGFSVVARRRPHVHPH